MTQGRHAAGESDKKKFITIGIIVVVMGIVVWQVMGLLGGSGGESAPAPAAAPTGMSAGGAQTPGAPPQPQIAKQPELPKPAVLSEREQQLMMLQQQTEAKYLAALNELQMLKLEKEIAQTNKEIAAARLETITAQKNVVNLLEPPTVAPNYANTLTSPTTAGGPNGVSGSGQSEVTYTVISVSQLESKWIAVIGNKGTLYQVSTGDILPPDGSKVISIDKSGVTLDMNGTQKKISMVPII